MIWSGLSGFRPTGDTGADNSDTNGSSRGSGALPTGASSVADSRPALVSGQSGSSPLPHKPTNPTPIVESSVLTGHVKPLPVGSTDSSKAGTGTGSGVSVIVHPSLTSSKFLIGASNSQGTRAGSASGPFWSPRYSLSWRVNTTATRRPVGTGTGNAAPTGHFPTGYFPHRPSPRPSPNNNETATCGGVTVNIPNATLDYWYTTALDYAAATFSIQFDGNDSSTGWTLVPATTTFNVTEALQVPSTYYLSATAAKNGTDVSATSYLTTVATSPTPVYASTVVVTQTATNTLNSTSGKGEIPADAVITPPPASTVLSVGPDDHSMTALTNTHFVYFSEYALDSEHTTTHKNGSQACATSRAVHHLETAYAMYYDGENPDGQELVTGTLPREFLRILPPNLKLAVGVFTAQPTLIVPVQIEYAADAALAITQEPTGTATSFFAYSSAVGETGSRSFKLAPLPSSSAAAFAPTLTGIPRPPVIFLKPTTTSSIAVTNSVLSQNVYIVSPTSTSARVEVTQKTLDLGPNPGPTQAPQQNLGSGSSDGNGSGESDTGSSDSGSSNSNSGSGNSDSGSGSSGSGVQNNNGDGGSGSQGNSGTGSQSGSGGGSNEGSAGGTSNAGSNGGTSSGSSGGSDTGGQTGGSSSGSNAGSSGSGGSNSNGADPGSSNSGGSGSGNSNSGGSNSGGIGSGSSSSGGSGSENSNSGGLNLGGSSSGGTGTEGQSSGNSGNSPGSSDNSNSGGSSSGGGNSSGSSSGGSSGGGSSGSDSGSSSGTNSGGSGTSSGNSDNSGSNAGSGSNGGSSPGSDSGSGGNVVIPVPVVVTIGSTKATVNPGSDVVIGSQTLVPERAAVTVDGTRVSIGSNAVVVGTETYNFQGSTVQAPGSNSPTAITFGGSVITQAPVPVYNVGGATIHAGQVVTVSGTVVSAASSGGVLVIGSETVSVPAAGSSITLNTAGRQVIVNPTPAYVVSGQTLEAGGPVVTVGGTRLSLAPSGTAIVINSETSRIDSPADSTKGALLTIGSRTFTADSSTRFSLAPDVILTPGGSATVEGATVHLGPSGFLASLAVVDGVTQTLSPPIITPAPAFYMGGTAYGTNGGSAFVVDGQVLTPGGVITVSGTVVSFAQEGTAVVVDGYTQPLAQTNPTDAPVLNIGGEAYTAQGGSFFIVDDQTLTRGGVITASGTKVSFAIEGTAVVVNGVTQALAQATPAPVLTIGGQKYTARTGSNFVIEGTTLKPGGVVTVDGTAISLASGGTAAVVNGVTQNFAQTTPASIFTVGDQAYTAQSGSTYVVKGQTLTPGGVITVDGTKISLASGGTAAVMNGVTQALSQAPSAAMLNIGGQAYTAQAGSTFVVGSQTLVPGGVITVDGTKVSLVSGGTAAVVNGVTQTLSQATAAPVLTLGGQTYTARSGSSFVIDGQTLAPGSVVTVDGTTISLASGGQFAVVDGVTETLAQATISPMLSVGGHTYTAQAESSYVIDGKTLTPGGVVTLTGGTTVSLGSSGSLIVINGVTSSIAGAAGATSPAVLTIGGKTYTGSSGAYVIDGQTLTSGGVVTLADGTTLSLGASVLVIDGKTSTIPAAASISPGVITIGGTSFRPLTGTGVPSYVIGGKTLQAAGSELTVTVSGKTYIVSLGAGATTVEIEVLGPGGKVIKTIYETLRGSGIGASTVTATFTETQGNAAASPTSRPGSNAAATGDASLQNSAPGDGVIGASVAFGAILAGALAIWL